jgi:hypothetical protein
MGQHWPYLGRRRRHLPRRLPIALIAFGLIVLAVPTVAWASFSSQTINASNKFSAGTLQLESAVPGPVNCFSTGTGSGGTVSSNVAQCSGSPLPTGQLTTSTTLSATTTLSSAGTVSATSGGIALLSCGVAKVADSSSTGNTGLIYGGVSYDTAFTSPVHAAFTSSGISLTGASGTYVGTTTSLTSPDTFTIVLWVNTSSTTGGGFIGFSNVQPDTGSSSQDRMLWVDSSGDVVFGVQQGTTEAEAVSSTKVNNGAWHFVAAHFSSSGLSLDVDGSTTTSTTITSATSYSGYWHLGWAGSSGWTNAGTNEYLNGSLFGVAVFGTAVSSTNLTTLEDETSLSAYTSKISSLSPTAEWLLSDTGTTPYTGTIPVLSSNQVCQRVLIDVQDTQSGVTSCAYPAAAGSCANPPTAGDLLTSLSSSGAITSSATFTVLIRMVLATASPAGVIGLHLLPDIASSRSVGSWSAENAYPSASLEL